MNFETNHIDLSNTKLENSHLIIPQPIRNQYCSSFSTQIIMSSDMRHFRKHIF